MLVIRPEDWKYNSALDFCGIKRLAILVRDRLLYPVQERPGLAEEYSQP
jgi:hypothetical protein